MAELHEALTWLAPLEWEDVPKDNLGSYLTEHFRAAELLVNSVPPPPSGTPFESSQPQVTTANAAKSSRELQPSPARPAPQDKDHLDLQKQWGKPQKFSQKENPLQVALYKMAGHDRHGAWFARHNIVEGIGFTKFSRALRREFPETLLTQGGPGEGAKRGLSAEQRIERIDASGVGRLEVYQLTAQMPSPVSPREFLTLLLSTDEGLTEKSAAELQSGDKHVPRNLMIISRPLVHPDVPHRAAFVRGQYESVELIREIPLHASSSDSNDPELNPVEWIMITRSDPGGGIPRFLVDRGTPGAMLTDVTKFLDWACGQDEIPDAHAEAEEQLKTSEQAKEETTDQSTTANANGDGTTETVEKAARETAAPIAVAHDQQQGGVVSSVTQTLEAGVQAYAPATVSNFVTNQLHPEDSGITRDLAEDISDTSSETSSVGSFMSAEEMRRLSTAPEVQPHESTEALSTASSSDLSKTDKKNLSRHDKELLKIMQQREKLDQKLAQKRAAEEDKLKQSQEKGDSEQSKARSKTEKEMKKTEERHRKEMEKLEAKRQKEARKAEERRKKKDDQQKLSLVARERDDFRSQTELMKKENDLLRDQVESLQRENTALATRLGKVGGADVLKSVQSEIAGRTRSRSLTARSSVESTRSGEKKDGS